MGKICQHIVFFKAELADPQFSYIVNEEHMKFPIPRE